MLSAIGWVEVEAKLRAHTGPEHDGKPFGKHDVLHDGSHDGTRLLKDELIPQPPCPSPEPLGQDVVVAHEDGVYEGQGGLLVDTVVSWGGGGGVKERAMM